MREIAVEAILDRIARAIATYAEAVGCRAVAVVDAIRGDRRCHVRDTVLTNEELYVRLPLREDYGVSNVTGFKNGRGYVDRVACGRALFGRERIRNAQGDCDQEKTTRQCTNHSPMAPSNSFASRAARPELGLQSGDFASNGTSSDAPACPRKRRTITAFAAAEVSVPMRYRTRSSCQGECWVELGK